MSVHHGRHWVANDVSLDTATTFMYAPINYFNIHSCTEAALASQTTITNPHKRMDRGIGTVSAQSISLGIFYPSHVTQQSELSFPRNHRTSRTSAQLQPMIRH